MTLTDADLNELLRKLTPAERRALDAALKGDRTATAAAILRWIRRRLKGKARAGKKRPATAAAAPASAPPGRKRQNADDPNT